MLVGYWDEKADFGGFRRTPVFGNRLCHSLVERLSLGQDHESIRPDIGKQYDE